jgi:flagellar protein FlaG
MSTIEPVGVSVASWSAVQEHRNQNSSPTRATQEGRMAQKQVMEGEETQAQVARQIDEFLQSEQTSLKIAVRQDTGTTSVKVVSQEGKVVREIPPEEWLDMVAKFRKIAGSLFHRRV